MSGPPAPDGRPNAVDAGASRAPFTALQVLGRLVVGAVLGLFGTVGVGFAALAGCCAPDPEGWVGFALFTGTSFGAAAWNVTFTRARWLPVFLVGGVVLSAVALRT